MTDRAARLEWSARVADAGLVVRPVSRAAEVAKALADGRVACILCTRAEGDQRLVTARPGLSHTASPESGGATVVEIAEDDDVAVVLDLVRQRVSQYVPPHLL